MKAFILACSLLSLLAICLPAQAETNSFDQVCGYFEELSKQTNVDKMSHLERNDFIVKKINKNLPQANNARLSWEAIAAAVAEQRYELFQSAAESVLNTKWQCKAMEQLAGKTGLFEN